MFICSWFCFLIAFFLFILLFVVFFGVFFIVFQTTCFKIRLTVPPYNLFNNTLYRFGLRKHRDFCVPVIHFVFIHSYVICAQPMIMFLPMKKQKKKRKSWKTEQKSRATEANCDIKLAFKFSYIWFTFCASHCTVRIRSLRSFRLRNKCVYLTHPFRVEFILKFQWRNKSKWNCNCNLQFSIMFIDWCLTIIGSLII